MIVLLLGVLIAVMLGATASLIIDWLRPQTGLAPMVAVGATIGALVGAAVSCNPPLQGPVVPDSATDGGCAFADKVTSSRLIANPDGTPLVIPCDAGAP